MEYDTKQIMKRFAEERKKFGTQEKLADIVGINAKNISAFETGKRNPSFKTFVKMCTVMNADVNYIFWGDNPNDA